MLSLPPAVQIFVCTTPEDMRRSFDGLAAKVYELGGEPLSGHLYVFRNRRGDRAKILFWDRTGYCLWYKRLERGVFHFPVGADGCVELEASELMLLLEGIDLEGARRRPRFRLASG
jgi:transposase